MSRRPVLCITRGCERITVEGKQWCKFCWRRIPELTRARIDRAAAFRARHPDDGGCERALQAAVNMACRHLNGGRRVVAP